MAKFVCGLPCSRMTGTPGRRRRYRDAETNRANAWPRSSCWRGRRRPWHRMSAAQRAALTPAARLGGGKSQTLKIRAFQHSALSIRKAFSPSSSTNVQRRGTTDTQPPPGARIAGRMVLLLQVRQFVDQDVVGDGRGHLDETEIQGDRAGPCDRPPARALVADRDLPTDNPSSAARAPAAAPASRARSRRSRSISARRRSTDQRRDMRDFRRSATSHPPPRLDDDRGRFAVEQDRAAGRPAHRRLHLSHAGALARHPREVLSHEVRRFGARSAAREW